jgi:hypothetical protein
MNRFAHLLWPKSTTCHTRLVPESQYFPTVRGWVCLLILSMLTTATMAGCGEDELFVSCPFDKTIQSICDTENDDGQLTCVVKTHPQCQENVCIGWRGHDSVCSRVCTPEGGECPSDATCAAFNERSEEYYCVPNSHL